MPNSSWIGTLDIDKFVKLQMDRETANIEKMAQPTIDQLTQDQGQLQTQSSVYTQIQQLVTGFQQSLTALQTAFNPAFQASYSVSGVANAQITGTVSPGTHSLSVTSLAQAGSLISTVFTSASSALGIGESVTISTGNPPSPASQFNITIKPGDSLQSVVNNINNTANINGVGVTASIISTSAGHYQIVVSANQTGVANKVNITDPNNAFGMTTLNTAADAKFTYDNLDYTQSTNSANIQGLDITLLSQGNTNIVLTPTNQVSSVTTAVQNVVSSYNQIMSLISQAQMQFATPDASLALIGSSLQDEMNLSAIAKLGIVPNTQSQTIQVALANGKGTTTVYLTGMLQVDPTMLNDALTNNFSETQKTLFNSNDGIFTKVLSDGLNPGTGAVWLTLNDPMNGAIPTVNRELSETKQKLDDENANVVQMKASLVEKYANLSVVLTEMQNTSNYIYEQMQVMKDG